MEIDLSFDGIDFTIDADLNLDELAINFTPKRKSRRKMKPKPPRR